MTLTVPHGVEEVGRRARKKQHTRDELVAAATRLFSERGFDETTTADIAEAADVSQRTFFRHFTSKEAVLYGDADEVAAAFGDAIRARPKREAPLTAVGNALHELAQLAAAGDPERTLLQAQLAARYPSVSAYSRAVVQRGLEQAVTVAVAERMGVDPASDPRPEVIAGATMSAVRYALRQLALSPGRSDLLELASKALISLRS
ncbi:MAG TPA: TetR family transcriptional regulator [Acidimicrobiales bacterium]|nr:TetR family transcriptional regulator [Acidimicrobiales bacterium]